MPPENYTFNLAFDQLDDEHQIVGGWANVSQVDGEDLEDTDGDFLPLPLVEEAAHQFMCNTFWPSRALGQQHVKNEDGNIAMKGEIVESIIIDDATAEVLKIGDPRRGWFIKAKIWDPTTWADVKAGRFTGFSIGALLTFEMDSDDMEDENEDDMEMEDGQYTMTKAKKPVSGLVGGKKRKLKSLYVREVSIVDQPANPESVITLAKAMEPETMTAEQMIQDLQKQLKEQADQIAEIKKSHEDRLAEVEKQREEAEAKAAELEKAAKKAAEPNDEAAELEKAFKEAPAVKAAFDRMATAQQESMAMIEKLAKQTQKMAEENERKEALLFVQKELSNLPGTEDQKVELVKSLNAMSPEARDYQLNLLKQAQKAATGLMDEIGTSAPGEGEGMATLSVEKAAQTFQQEFEKAKEKTPTLSMTAFLATEKGQALYKAQQKAMGLL